MKTISLNLYRLDELSDEAQQKAIQYMSHLSYESGSEEEWANAEEAIKDFEEAARVHPDIEWSSHGYSCDRIKDEIGDLTDEEDVQYWLALKDIIYEWNDKGDYWETELRKQFLIYEPDDNKSYQRNVANFLCEFCDSVQDVCYSYIDEDNVREYINANDYWFTEDGSLYR